MLVVTCVMIRTVEPFDWEKTLRAWIPKLTEARTEGHVYYKLGKDNMIGGNACLYFPDNRTVVLNTEEDLVRVIHRNGRPAYLQAINWERLAGSLLAAVIDNRDGRMSSIPGKAEKDDVELALLFKNAQGWAVGLADEDQVGLRALATCVDATAGEATARAAEGLLRTLLEQVDQSILNSSGDKKDQSNEALRLEKVLASSLHVTRNGSTVSIAATGAPKLADLFGLLLADAGVPGQVEPGKSP
jgi:hypothetical protein